MQKTASVLIILSLAATGFAQSTPAPAPGPACTTTVAQTATDAGLTTLLAAVQAAGLTSTLANPNLAYTVFAPTNEAFAEALAALNLTASQVLSNSALLTPVLTNHLVAYPLPAADLLGYGSVATLNNNARLNITSVYAGNETVVEVSTPVTTANVIMADIRACKSIVHVIDQVLVPGNIAL